MDSQDIIVIIAFIVLTIFHFADISKLEREKKYLKAERDFYREKYLEKP